MTSTPYQIFCDSPSCPMNTRKMAPAKPSMTPRNLLQEKARLKRRKACSKVNSGVRELKSPVRELLSWVWAVANKKAGIKLPAKPTMSRCRVFDQSIRRKCSKKMGKKAREEMLIRRQANCSGAKATRPFLIRM